MKREYNPDLLNLCRCPFCGGRPIAVRTVCSGTEDIYLVYIECEVCGARTKPYRYARENEEYKDDFGYLYPEDWGCSKAISAWERRCE